MLIQREDEASVAVGAAQRGLVGEHMLRGWGRQSSRSGEGILRDGEGQAAGSC